MTSSNLLALAPWIALLAAPLAVLAAITLRRSHLASALTAGAGLAGSAACVPFAFPLAPRQVTSLFVVDRYALFYTGLLACASLAAVALSYGYLKKREEQPEEFYILLLVATLGSSVLVASSHFASFFLGFELLSVSLYALIAYPRRARPPLEAGVKYLILAGASSAFLLFGMALLYVFGGIGVGLFFMLRRGWVIWRPAAMWGALVSLLQTLALVPFHVWTPDVYMGAPAPVTAFVATVSKGGMVAFMLRFVTELGPGAAGGAGRLFGALSAIAVASMVVGNLAALLQTNVKRILAYSSIAHLGYLLVAILAGGSLAQQAVAYYLAAYFVTTLGAFGVVIVLSSAEREAETLDDYRGLLWSRPWLALILTASLLSLAGIPLTGGFLAKFYVFAAGVVEPLGARRLDGDQQRDRALLLPADRRGDVRCPSRRGGRPEHPPGRRHGCHSRLRRRDGPARADRPHGVARSLSWPAAGAHWNDRLQTRTTVAAARVGVSAAPPHSPSELEEIGDLGLEARQDLLAVQFFAAGDDARREERSVNGHPRSPRIDDPDHTGACCQVVGDLGANIVRSVAWREHLDGEIGSARKCPRHVADRLEALTGDERDIGPANRVRCTGEKEARIARTHNPEPPRANESPQQLGDNCRHSSVPRPRKRLRDKMTGLKLVAPAIVGKRVKILGSQWPLLAWVFHTTMIRSMVRVLKQTREQPKGVVSAARMLVISDASWAMGSQRFGALRPESGHAQRAGPTIADL